MAISLNDHESRIKALENRSSRIIFGGYVGYTRWFWITKLRIPSNTQRRIFVSSRTDTEGPEYMQIYDSSNLTEPVSICNGENVIEFVENNGEFIIYEIKSSGEWFNNILQVYYQLKLYYNFSYNIYRLANSILFHFFRCLVNSFKGGVKEIWRLVLRIMKIA